MWQQERQEYQGRWGRGVQLGRRQASLSFEHILPRQCKTHACTQADALINRLPSLIALQLLYFFGALPVVTCQ